MLVISLEALVVADISNIDCFSQMYVLIIRDKYNDSHDGNTSEYMHLKNSLSEIGKQILTAADFNDVVTYFRMGVINSNKDKL